MGRMSREEALRQGELRRQEALERRKQFLHEASKENEIEAFSIEVLKDTSPISNISVKSREQLEEERDAMVNQTILQYQRESSIMRDRLRKEEESRQKQLRHETVTGNQDEKQRQTM